MSLCMILTMPSTQSSMYMKLRVCLPSPQISISSLPVSMAWITLRQIAAGAFSRPPSQVPCGPYTLWNRATRVVEAVVFAEVAAHPLGEQLLPAVAVFGHRGVGVVFLERHDVFAAAACRRCRRRRC